MLDEGRHATTFLRTLREALAALSDDFEPGHRASGRSTLGLGRLLEEEKRRPNLVAASSVDRSRLARLDGEGG